MKYSAVSLLFAALVVGSPLGDPVILKRHKDLSRDFILRSQINAPKTCSLNTSPLPLPPNITVPDANITFPNIPTVDSNSTTIDNNSTTIDNNSTTVDDSPTTVDNSTSPDNSTDTSSRRSLSIDRSEWQTLCAISGGGIYSNFDLNVGLGCINWAGIDAVSALYAEADVCEQQLNADFMISWAKEFGGINTQLFIAQALRYRRYPRRVVKVLDVYPATPYCLLEPINTELIGVYNEQLPFVDYGLYGGPNFPLVSFGGDESCPFGWTADISTCTCSKDSHLTPPPSDFNSTTIDFGNATSTDTADGTDVTDTGVADTTSTDSADAARVTADGTDNGTGDNADTGANDGADSNDTANDSPSGISGNINDPAGR